MAELYLAANGEYVLRKIVQWKGVVERHGQLVCGKIVKLLSVSAPTLCNGNRVAK